MLWCCSLFECDKNNPVNAIVNIFRPTQVQVDNDDNLEDPLEGGLTNPCLDDVTASENLAPSNANTGYNDSPSPEYRPSPDYLRVITAALRDPLHEASAVFSSECVGLRLQQELEVGADAGLGFAPEVSPVDSVVSVNDRKSWGRWWSSRRSPSYETFCEQPSSQLASGRHQQVASKCGQRSSGCHCVLVRLPSPSIADVPRPHRPHRPNSFHSRDARSPRPHPTHHPLTPAEVHGRGITVSVAGDTNEVLRRLVQEQHQRAPVKPLPSTQHSKMADQGRFRGSQQSRDPSETNPFRVSQQPRNMTDSGSFRTTQPGNIAELVQEQNRTLQQLNDRAEPGLPRTLNLNMRSGYVTRRTPRPMLERAHEQDMTTPDESGERTYDPSRWTTVIPRSVIAGPSSKSMDQEPFGSRDDPNTSSMLADTDSEMCVEFSRGGVASKFLTPDRGRREQRLALVAETDTLRSPLEDSSSGSSPGDYSSVWRRRSGSGLPRQSSLDSGGPDDASDVMREAQGEQPLAHWQTDSTTPSDEEEAPGSSCGVPYTDMAQLDKVNEEMAELLETSVGTPAKDAEKIKGQCVALWQLRSTLEEEDPDSDVKTGATPDEHSPDSDIADKQSPPEGGQSDGANTGGLKPTAPTTLLSSEARRTSYRAILAHRLKHLDGSSRSQVSSENSFDSVDTDNSSIADVSRPDLINASVDSAFDGSVDPATDDQSGRPHQIKKTDSGYRSMEVSTTSKYSTISWSQNTVDDTLTRSTHVLKVAPECSDNEGRSPEDDKMSRNMSPDEHGSGILGKSRKAQFHQSRRMWHSICAEPSFMDTDTPSSSYQGDTAELYGAAIEPSDVSPQIAGKKRREVDLSGDEASGKRSVMVRFMSPHKYSLSQQLALQRDYSIDEKSDRLFREFSRYEPLYGTEFCSNTVPRRGRRNRRNVRHLDVSEGSPRSHRRKLSPQDSIEEESPMDTGRDTSLPRGTARTVTTASSTGTSLTATTAETHFLLPHHSQS